MDKRTAILNFAKDLLEDSGVGWEDITESYKNRVFVRVEKLCKDLEES